MIRPDTTDSGRRASTGPARVVSIISGKGGVGKSVVAFNLAERLARVGLQVLLVDGDLNCGNLHILANSSGEYGLREFIREDLSLREAAGPCRQGFDLLAAGGGEVIWTDGDITPVAGAVAQLRREGAHYDIILIDHGSGVSKTATVMAHASDISILLVVPELTSISDCYGLFKHLKTTDSHIDCKLLVNRVESAEQAEYIHSKICAVSERFIDQTPAYLGCLREDQRMRESVARQSALAEISMEADVVKELTAVARRLVGYLYPKAQALEEKPLNSTRQINKTTALADIRE